MKKTVYPLVLVSMISLTACSSAMESLPFVYTLDVQQGNIINQEMIDKLKPKMTKRQVLYVMGSSMLKDVFHKKRWDYLYSEQLDGEPRKQKRLALFFNGNILSNIQGDFRPSSTPTKRKSTETTVNVPPRNLEKTLWEKITGIFSSDEIRNTQSMSKEKITDAEKDLSVIKETGNFE